MKKILLTGGGGFIGRNILESFLAEKYEITSPGSKQLDLTDPQAVENFFAGKKFDAVIHAAGKPGHRNAADPTGIFYADMVMFLNLLRQRESLGKIIVLGSGAVYDQARPIVKAKEGDYILRVPADEHALYRRVSAELLEHMKEAVELRLFGVFGKYEDYAIRFISNAICKAMFDLPITIKQNRSFDYLYIDDLMPILDYFIQRGSIQGAYNITPDKPIELAALAEKVKTISGKELPIKIAMPGLGNEYSGDNGKFKREFTDFKFTPLDDSLTRLYSWYEQHKSEIDRQALLTDK